MEEQAEEEATKYCSNCKKDIAVGNFSIHEIHCKRHIVLCKHCEEPVRRDELDDHCEDFHTETQCDWCRQTMERYQLEEHKEDDCPERMIHCEYCDLGVKASDYEDHENICGSRTDECALCRKRVMLRYMAEHQKNNCVKSRRPKVNCYKKPLPPTSIATPLSQTPPIAIPLSHTPPTVTPLSSTGSLMKESPRHPSIPVKVGPVARDKMVPLSYTATGRAGELSPVNSDCTNEALGLPVNAGKRTFPSVRVDSGLDQCPPIPLERTRPDEGEGLEVVPSNTTIVFDPEWVGSVAMALNDDKELDRILAGNVYHEDLRRKEEKYPLPSENDGSEANDEELAQKLQREFHKQNETSISDALLAKGLNGREPTYTPSVVDSVLTNRDHAHRLYDALDEVLDEDGLLARQLQEEEKFAKDGGNSDDLSTMMVYDRSVLHRRVEQEKEHQVERDHKMAAFLQQQEKEDREMAAQLQEENGCSLYDGELGSERELLSAGNDRVSPLPPPPVYPSVPSLEHSGSPPLVTTGDTPSSPDQGIPCDVCGAVVDFDQYQDHLDTAHPHFTQYIGQFQSHDSIYRPPPRKIDPPPLYHAPSPTSSPHESFYHIPGYGVTREERKMERDDDKPKCDYCGFSYPRVILMSHMTLCDENPEKDLKKAYQKQDEREEDEEEDITAELNATIPCEFCEKPVCIIELSEHQKRCRRSRRGRRSLDRAKLEDKVATAPCDCCGEQFPLNEIHTHQVTCEFRSSHVPGSSSSRSLNPSLFMKELPLPLISAERSHPIRPHPSSDNETPSEETVPCQFCGKQCSFSQLEDHQMTCRFTLGNTNAFDLVEPDSQAAAVTVSCNMCHREFLKKDIHSHKGACRLLHLDEDESIPVSKSIGFQKSSNRSSINTDKPSSLEFPRSRLTHKKPLKNSSVSSEIPSSLPYQSLPPKLFHDKIETSCMDDKGTKSSQKGRRPKEQTRSLHMIHPNGGYDLSSVPNVETTTQRMKLSRRMAANLGGHSSKSNFDSGATTGSSFPKGSQRRSNKPNYKTATGTEGSYRTSRHVVSQEQYGIVIEDEEKGGKASSRDYSRSNPGSVFRGNTVGYARRSQGSSKSYSMSGSSAGRGSYR